MFVKFGCSFSDASFELPNVQKQLGNSSNSWKIGLAGLSSPAPPMPNCGWCYIPFTGDCPITSFVSAPTAQTPCMTFCALRNCEVCQGVAGLEVAHVLNDL